MEPNPKAALIAWDGVKVGSGWATCADGEGDDEVVLLSEVAAFDASNGFGFTSGLDGAAAFFLVALVTAGFAMETFGGLLALMHLPPPDLLEMKEYALFDEAEFTEGKRRGRMAIVFECGTMGRRGRRRW